MKAVALAPEAILLPADFDEYRPYSRLFKVSVTDIAPEIEDRGYLGKTVGIKLRYADFHTLTRDITLEAPTADAETIRSAARVCLKRVPLDRRLRLLGVRVASLVPLRGDNDPVSVMPSLPPS